jgi:hypothetical protein
VSELVDRGVDLKKIVVVKPVAPNDSTGSGWMDAAELGQSVTDAYDKLKWFAGVGYWQYNSDVRGRSMTVAAGHLKELCASNKDCK